MTPTAQELHDRIERIMAELRAEAQERGIRQGLEIAAARLDAES